MSEISIEVPQDVLAAIKATTGQDLEVTSHVPESILCPISAAEQKRELLEKVDFSSLFNVSAAGTYFKDMVNLHERALAAEKMRFEPSNIDLVNEMLRMQQDFVFDKLKKARDEQTNNFFKRLNSLLP